MLILSRHVNEEILIGTDVVVKVVRIDGDRVKLGISAPKDTPVDRAEVRRMKNSDDGSTGGLAPP